MRKFEGPTRADPLFQGASFPRTEGSPPIARLGESYDTTSCCAKQPYSKEPTLADGSRVCALAHGGLLLASGITGAALGGHGDEGAGRDVVGGP